MQKPEVRAFKNELRNYAFYVSQVNTIANSIEFLYDRLGGVRGVDPSREPMHTLPNKDLEYKLRDDITLLEIKKSRLEHKIKEIDMMLDLIELPIRTAIISCYVHGNQVKMVADKFFMSPSGLAKRMDRAIERAMQ